MKAHTVGNNYNLKPMNLSLVKIGFPWLSAIYSTIIGLYFFALTSSDKVISNTVPAALREEDIIQAALSILVLIILLDYLRFRRRKKKIRTQLLEFDRHLQEILKSKSKLQAKAHTYSDHADKLKLFISERLLEHIEYDEKYLHFKNIASEVRHNGVISYDKVKTALETAISNARKENAQDQKTQYTDALTNMRYLWDLLDLSTTDNIAMYVANKLYEAEEQYCQLILEEDRHTQSYNPTYFAYDAVIAALPDFVDKKLIRHNKNKSRRKVVAYADNKLLLELEKSIQLLGNINYFVLLIENLLNNALFYLNKKNVGNKYSRISIALKKSRGNAVLSVYNPGPIISDDIKDKIFQLGFSTRRNKENNGKGLGLYFVNQIAKGNEGSIEFDNVKNQPKTFELHISGDTEFKETVEVIKDENEQLICQTKDDKTATVEYKPKDSITGISIRDTKSHKTYSMEIDSSQTENILFDPEHPEAPQWCVEYFKLKTMNKLVFRPLNVTGVRFTVTIPTAESRLEVDYHELESEEINKLENPDVDFDDEDRELYR